MRPSRPPALTCARKMRRGTTPRRNGTESAGGRRLRRQPTRSRRRCRWTPVPARPRPRPRPANVHVRENIRDPAIRLSRLHFARYSGRSGLRICHARRVGFGAGGTIHPAVAWRRRGAATPAYGMGVPLDTLGPAGRPSRCGAHTAGAQGCQAADFFLEAASWRLIAFFSSSGMLAMDNDARRAHGRRTRRNRYVDCHPNSHSRKLPVEGPGKSSGLPNAIVGCCCRSLILRMVRTNTANVACQGGFGTTRDPTRTVSLPNGSLH